MAEEKVLKFRRVAEYFRSENEELQNTIPAPFIIAMKGDPATGRKLMAFLVASVLRCPLIKEHDFDNFEEKTEENQERIWRKICELASSQLKFGRPIVLDTELANQYEFNLLKESSEKNKTLLVVYECRVDDAFELWEHGDSYVETKNSNEPIAFEFLEKPTSRVITPTNYNMGEILKIPVDMGSTWTSNDVVPYVLKHLRDHINPHFASEESNDCEHLFSLNIDDEYQRRCCKCKQLVSGSFYRCCCCRLIVHRTCCSFPESLCLFQDFLYQRVPLSLQYVLPELDADATCSCCMQLLSGQYYSSEDGLSLLDLDCLFSLPAKRRMKPHKHELLRCISEEQHLCSECDARIDKSTIFYYCVTCSLSFDVYCVWLPDTAEFDRHRHPFKLSIVPAADPLPYYCEVCQEERNTERWIYYCEECDYPIHPRCIVEAPSLLRSVSTQLSISNKKSKEKLAAMEFQSCSSHSSDERVMVKELPWEHRSEAKELHILLKELLKETELPILVTTKGHSDTGRKVVASILAATLDCLLIDDDLCEVTNIAKEPKCYQEISRIATSQLQIGLSVVIDSDFSHETELCFLRDLALATEMPLFIVECKLCNGDILEDFHKITNISSDYEYAPKLFVNISTPTFDGIKELMPHILQSISAYSKQWRKRHSKESENGYCHRHDIPLGLDYDVSEGETCNRCSKQLSTPILKCKDCSLILHKNCTKLPLCLRLFIWSLILEKYVENNNFSCVCCNESVKDYAYTSSDINFNYLICIDCLFTPPKPSINLHEHPIELSICQDGFQCGACGSYCKEKLCYRCKHPDCYFLIGVKCGLLEETVPFDRHRHSFHLIISPEHVSNQYYCEVCGEERDKDHWVYCCIECDYFIHVRCLVPTGGCPPYSCDTANADMVC